MAEEITPKTDMAIDAGIAPKSENLPVQVTPIRLTKDNYLSWSAALEIGITSRGRLPYITGDKPAPSKTDPQTGRWRTARGMWWRNRQHKTATQSMAEAAAQVTAKAEVTAEAEVTTTQSMTEATTQATTVALVMAEAEATTVHATIATQQSRQAASAIGASSCTAERVNNNLTMMVAGSKTGNAYNRGDTFHCDEGGQFRMLLLRTTRVTPCAENNEGKGNRVLVTTMAADLAFDNNNLK
ncbi:hypothetical protein EJ110_NYTH53765 [Nymphaea thermarum]|nr:hypothetical protein EJ110_NYTH53765 [Nymphaea thermarum]